MRISFWDIVGALFLFAAYLGIPEWFISLVF